MNDRIEIENEMDKKGLTVLTKKYVSSKYYDVLIILVFLVCLIIIEADDLPWGDGYQLSVEIAARAVYLIIVVLIGEIVVPKFFIHKALKRGVLFKVFRMENEQLFLDDTSFSYRNLVFSNEFLFITITPAEPKKCRKKVRFMQMSADKKEELTAYMKTHDIPFQIIDKPFNIWKYRKNKI